MEFICKRCGYRTERKANMKKHLSTKYECEPIFQSIVRRAKGKWTELNPLSRNNPFLMQNVPLGSLKGRVWK